MTDQVKKPECAEEVEGMRARLAEADDTLHAIRHGEVDAVVVAGQHGEQVYSLTGADRVYRQLIETMNEGALTLSADGIILYGNIRLAKMLGRPLDQVIGTHLRDYLPFADQPALAAILMQARNTPSRREINMITSAGRPLPVYLSASRLQSIGVEMIYCLVATDLTEQKVHEQIAAAERLARLILEQSIEAIVVCDAQGRVIRVNHAAEQLCDGSSLLRPFCEAYPLQIDAAKPCDLTMVLGGKTLQNVDGTLEQNGQKHELLLNAGPLLDGRQIVGCVVTMTNITERKQAEEQLKNRLEELQRWQDVMLGREDRVQDLKREVNELCRHHGDLARYPSQETGAAEAANVDLKP